MSAPARKLRQLPPPSRDDRRVAPQSIEAEIAVLGGVLLDGTVIDRVNELLSPDDFYREAHRKIMRAMADLHQRSEPVDLVTLAELLKARHELADVGGATYLAEMADKVPEVANIAHHAKIVHEKSVARSIIQSATEVVEQGYESTGAHGQLLADAMTRLTACYERRTATVGIEPTLQTDVRRFMTAFEHLVDTGTMLVPGLPTGLWELDNLTGGLRNGNLTIIGGRPSQGKTALLVNIARSLGGSPRPVPVVFASCEMSRDEITQRLISQVSGLDLARLWRGPILAHEVELGVAAAASVEQMHIRVLDHTDDWDELAPLISREVASGARLVMIDHLWKLRASRGPEVYWERIRYLTGQMKERARRWNVPVILTVVLGRESVRSGKSPRIHELGGGGCVEADADNIALIYREDPDDRTQAEEAQLILAKHRNGPTGVVTVRWQKATAQFADRFADPVSEPEEPAMRELWR